MELHDICDGCGRHPGVCMCSCSIGPEGATINRPNPVNLAGKLRIIAGNSMIQNHQTKIQSVPDQIRHRAKRAADSGSLRLQIWLSEYNLTEEAAKLVASELERDGFKCELKDEITSMYSNTDWDSEYQLTVSWE